MEDMISLGEVDPIRPDVPRIDWSFSLEKNGVDPVLGIKYLSEIYTSTDPNYEGRSTVPAVVDIKNKKIVHNDYFTLTNYFETAWRSEERRVGKECRFRRSRGHYKKKKVQKAYRQLYSKH